MQTCECKLSACHNGGCKLPSTVQVSSGKRVRSLCVDCAKTYTNYSYTWKLISEQEQQRYSTAAFNSRCPKCELLITAGELIARLPNGKFGHAACAEHASTGKSDTDATLDAIYGDDVMDNKTSQPSTQDALGASLAAAVLPHLQGRLQADVSQVREQIDSALDQMKQALAGDLDKLDSKIDEAVAKRTALRIEVVKPNGDIKPIEQAHCLMPKLLYLAQRRINTILFGPSQSGKSTAAMQVADALGLDFHMDSLSPGTLEHRLLGFRDANGQYHASGLRRVYGKGGLWLIDEADNAAASLLTTVNSLLIQSKFSFPDGLVEKHPDFVVVATANTAGRGASRAHAERRAFDAAFAQRFFFIEWSYDERLERSIALGFNPQADRWIDWVQEVRGFAREKYPTLLATPQASFMGAKMLLDAVWTVEEIADGTVFKGIDIDTRRTVLNTCSLPYYELGGK